MKDLSIVIVNYNVKHFTELAIESALKAGRSLDIECLVVDNHSKDGSLEYLMPKFPQVTFIQNQRNTGFAVANNQAIQQCTGRYILLLNPDTIVGEDTLQHVVSFMDHHPEAGALGIRMLDGSGSFLPESKRAFPGPAVAFYKAFGLASLFPQSPVFGRYHLGHLSPDEIHEVDVLAGAFMLLRQEALLKTGLLDEAFFMYGEDIDLSYRIRQAGYRNYYLPEPSIVHFKGESTKKGSLNYVQMFYNAMKIFARKHFTGKHQHIFIFFINMAIYFRAFLAILGGFFRRWAPAFTDILLLTGAQLLVKEYWEYYVRYIDGGKYPASYYFINIPIYTFIWITTLFLSGSYDRQANALSILRGVLWGTILIAAVYGFFPENLRYSRGMIVAGAATATVLLLAYRYISHFIKYKNIRYGMDPNKRIILLANQPEADRVFHLMEQAGWADKVIGYCGEASPKATLPCLGNTEQLSECIELYKPGELVFCLQHLSHRDAIGITQKYQTRLSFKWVAPGSQVVVGSDSKNTTGERYDVRYRLDLPYNRRLKRLIDVAASTFLILFLPVGWIFIPHTTQLLTNTIAVLQGKKTWVGYIHLPDSYRHLPVIPEGILPPVTNVNQPTTPSAAVLNRLYASEYSPAIDLLMLLKKFRHLGSKP